MIKVGILSLLILIAPVPAAAASHYVRAAASGNGSGSDWNNAYLDLPTFLVRGDVYYVATGIYGAHYFNDANSGASVIEIRGATVEDHGTATGWVNSFAGTATFTAAPGAATPRGGVFEFQKNYYVINGQTRSADWLSGYGIKISNTNRNATNADIIIGQFYVANGFVDNIRLSYVEIDGSHVTTDAGPNESGVNIGSGSQNITLEYFYIHDLGSTGFHMRGPGGFFGSAGFRLTDNILFQYGYLARNYGSAVVHSEGCACSDGVTNFTIRYSYWMDLQSTAFIATPSGGSWNNGNWHNGPWLIYGNVFGYTQNSAFCGAGNGVLGIFDVSFDGHIYFLNNTIANLQDGAPGCVKAGASTGTSIIGNIDSGNAHLQTVYIANNLVWASTSANFNNPAVGTTVMDYNAYYTTSHARDPGAHTQDGGTGNPFTNWLGTSRGTDFTLPANTLGGLDTSTLVGGNSTDMNGRPRATWTRGAFEFSPGAGLNAPTSLRVQ